MNFLYRIKDQFLPKYGGRVVLGLLILIFLTGTLAWLSLDTSPATDPDANFYMVRTLAYLDRPEDQSIGQLWQSIKDLNMEGRPPLYQLLSMPLVLVFGRSMDSGAYVNLFFAILLLVAVYNIGKLIVNGNAGLLAAIITAGYPTLVSLSRNYRPYFAVAACVALNVWLLLLLQKNRSIKIAWLLGLSLAFGFWLYPLYLWVAPIPSAIFCLYLIFFQPDPSKKSIKQLPAWVLSKVREPIVFRGFLPVSLVSITLVLAWYLTGAAKPLIEIQKWVNSPQVIDFRGTNVITLGFNNIPASFWWYVLTSPNAISTVFVVLLVIGFFSSLLKRNFSETILLTFFVVGYLALSLQGGLMWRYFSMLLPVAAVLSAVWVCRIQNKFISSSLFLLCAVTSAFNYSITTYGLQPWNGFAANYLGVISGIDAAKCSVSPGWGFCPSPPLGGKWPVSSALESVLKDQDCKQNECNIMVVSQTGYIHWTVFTYYLKQDFPLSTASILNAGNPDMGIPLNLPGLLNSQYLIYESMPKPSGATFNESFLRFLLSQPAGFANTHKEIARFVLPNGHMIKVIKQVKPLTIAETEQAIAAVDGPEKYKILQYDVLATLYEKEGDLKKAKMYYDQGLSVSDLFQHVARTDIKYIEEVISYQDTIAGYQHILEGTPDNFDAHSNLAIIYQDLNDCVNAIPHWIARLETQKNYTTYTDLGDAYLKCEDWGNAIKVYQPALEFDKKAPRARFGLALAFAADGQMDAAAREFKKVIKYAPESDYARQAQGWLDKNQ